MRRLTRFREREDGAIATIVAMLFFFGVMLALGALTVDVGNINANRRQLQNGADAVALAFAQQCATNATCDPNVSKSSLGDLAKANAADGYMTISRVDGVLGTLAICGKAANALNLPACPTSWGSMWNLQECPSPPPSGASYVRAYTQTTNAAGDHILPYYFGAAITGIEGANQQACATVGYGNGKLTGPILPIAMSYCEWKAATGADPEEGVAGEFEPEPVYSDGVPYGYADVATTSTPAWPATEREIYTAKTLPGLECDTWNGHTTPGNFSALDQSPNGSCEATASDWISGDTGNDAPCTDAQLAVYRGKVVLVPLFDCVASPSTTTLTPTTDCQAPGNDANYHIAGYGAFYLTGWKFSSTNDPYDRSVRDNEKVCQAGTGASGRCMSGWFTRAVITNGEVGEFLGVPDFGTTFIQMLQ